jgi:replication fork clamp-binding protein CrfC
MNILVGNIIPLHHGFVGVVNRSQHDINNNTSIQQALKAERHFFSTHPIYRSIANRLGTAYLARRLNSLLLSHIQQCLPELRAKLSHTITETETELEGYGSPLDPAQINMGSVLLPLISRFCGHFCDALEGKSPDVSIAELYGGARISYVFRELFSVTLDAINPFDYLSDGDIRTAIRNASGPRPTLFIPEIAFELLVKKQIERLLTPSLDCVDLVYHELQRVALQCEGLTPEIQRFPRLRAQLTERVNELLRSRLEPTKLVINNILHCELSYINTNHPDFIGGNHAVVFSIDRLKRAQKEMNGVKFNQTNNAINEQRRNDYMEQYRQQQAAAAAAKAPSSVSSSSSSSVPPSVNAPAPARTGFFNSLFRAADSALPAAQAPASSPTASSSSSASIPSSFSAVLSHPNSHSSSSAAPSSSQLLSPSAQPSTSSNSQSLPSSIYDSADFSNGVSLHLKHLAPTDREIMETEVIKTLISSYFSIVKKNVSDLIPKSIMGFLVHHTKKELQSELVKQLYNPQHFVSLLSEAEDISEKRESCKELLSILKRAMDILNTARDYNPMANQ